MTRQKASKNPRQGHGPQDPASVAVSGVTPARGGFIDWWLACSGVVAVVLLAWWWVRDRQGMALAELPALAVRGAGWSLGVGLVAALGVQVLRSRRRARERRRAAVEARVREGLLTVVGHERGAAVRVSSWDGTSPRQVQMKLPQSWEEHLESGDRRLRDSLHRATGQMWSAGDYEPVRLTAHTVARAAWSVAPDLTAEERHRQEVEDRVDGIVRKALNGARSVRVSDWTEDGDPARIKVTYRPSPALVSGGRQRAIETVIGATLDGRWRGVWDTEQDRVIFEQRPGLPESVRRPRDLEIPSSVTLRYAVDEDGAWIGWKLEGSSPHALVVGPTGGGKTYLLRAMILDALAQGVEVYGADPKRIELNGLDGLPGVAQIATSPAEIAGLIENLHALMEHRYELLEARWAKRHELKPVLFVLDEFFILVMRLNRLWQQRPDTKGKEHPAIGLVWEMLALARSARIHLAVGIQRPDAAFVDGPARDNLRHRASLSTLSPDGARMMWQDMAVGVDLPPVPGRATATGADGKPREAQVFLVPNPDPHEAAGWSEEDRQDLAAIFGAEWVRNPVKGEETYELDGLRGSASAMVIEGEVVDAQAMTDDQAGEDEDGTSPEPPPDQDELLEEALAVVQATGYASAAMIGRKLRVGHVAAGQLLTRLCEQGVVVQDGERYTVPADPGTSREDPVDQEGGGMSPPNEDAPDLDAREDQVEEEDVVVPRARPSREGRARTEGSSSWGPASADELVVGDRLRLDGRTYQVLDVSESEGEDLVRVVVVDEEQAEAVFELDPYETVSRAR